MLGKRKRALQLEPQQCESLRQILVEQIDLEIALKRRLAAAAHARLEWAKLLRNSIEDSAKDVIRGHPPNAFRDAAEVAYENIEAPCQVVSSTSNLPLSPSQIGKFAVIPAATAPEAPRTRKRVTLGLTQGLTAGPLLFEERSTASPVTLKLVCTDCSRSDFPTMQGFLNHCRLAHSRVYGTHDECIQATGVIVNDEERESLVALGVEINTIHLPSLKSMFERAVGMAPTMGTLSFDAITQSDPVEDSLDMSTHLSQTLGYHKDTPTLAPFLGKEVKRKCIHVYDDSGGINITSYDEDEKPSYSRISLFVKQRPRQDSDNNLSINLAALAMEKTGEIKDLPKNLPPEPLDGVTRFHVTRRLLISDRSLYLSEAKRPVVSPTHTHRWQISVSSPSYSHHITTFLSRLIVTCVTQPPVFTAPIIVPSPPFIACSTTDRPFLARLTFDWVGELNHSFEVDHWVELDQLKAARPILGDEQVIDVELDRRTVFLPVHGVVNNVSWNGEDDYSKNDVVDGHLLTSQPAGSVASEPAYIKLLRSIVPRFPMTMQDLGTRQWPVLPYTLYPSRLKLLSQVPGRRKAIEAGSFLAIRRLPATDCQYIQWARALAIRTEFDTLHTPSLCEDNVHLTTADVYRWLNAEGLFPRPRVRTAKPPPQATPATSITTPSRPLNVPPRYCSVCGVDVYHHNPGVRVASEDQLAGFQCPSELERRRSPIIHVYALLAPTRTARRVAYTGRIGLNSRDLVTVAHPQLTRLVRQKIASLSLSCFSVVHEAKRDPGLLLDDSAFPLGRNRREVDETLSTHALLALTLEQLIKDLVRGAVQVAREMHDRTKANHSQAREGVPPTPVLTPTQVLQGLLIKEADLGGPKEALFKYYSRVGAVLAMGTTGTTTRNPSGVQHQQGVYDIQGGGG